MLVVIAEKEELKLVEELGYNNFPILITGVGGMNVIDALKDIPRDTEILNIGYVGSNYWGIGTRLQITAVGTNHEKAQFTEDMKFLNMKLFEEYDDSAFCYTSTDFVEHTDKINPCVFDMELAFIRAIFKNVRSIKVVSDNLNKNEYNNIIKGEEKNDRKSKSKTSR